MKHGSQPAAVGDHQCLNFSAPVAAREHKAKEERLSQRSACLESALEDSRVFRGVNDC
jgi:hypothetical protein